MKKQALWFLLCILPIGCRQPAADETADVGLTFAVNPNPPKVGPVAASVRLVAKDGRPVQGASLKFEGNMNHAGMKPVFAGAREVEPGQYEASLELTMGGDWFVLITGTLADGRKLSRKMDMPGVKTR